MSIISNFIKSPRLAGLTLIVSALLLMSCGKKEYSFFEPPKEEEIQDTNKYVALFYFANYGDTMYGPDCISPTGDAWIMQGQTPLYSPLGIPCFWGKPAWAANNGDGTIKNNYRYYFNGDPTQTNNGLLDYHADLITQAKVDVIVLDFTNGAADFQNAPSYISATTALLNRWKQRKELSLPFPKVAFFVRNQDALTVVENLFFTKYDDDLFFNYLGKKLLLVADPNNSGDNGNQNQPPVPTNGKFANYTTRHCWALDNTGYCWQFKTTADTPPPAFEYNGKPEQMSASMAVAGTADGNVLLPGSQGRQNGAFFKKYVDAAINADVKFLFINSWNEWTAANLSANPQKPFFVDQWLTEYSSDAEPMAGGHEDQYYQLMKEQIARFKN